MEECEICLRKCRDIWTHMMEHNAASFQCDICLIMMRSRKQIAYHMAQHVNARAHKCLYCPRTFNHRSTLNKHCRTHSAHTFFQCELCGASFKHSHSLRVHSYRHTGEKPHKCDMCDNAYTTNLSLSLHRRIHLNVRPFQCADCSKSFHDASTLAVHARQHTGEAPFICHLCGKSCKQASNLKSHYRHYHKIHEISGKMIRENARKFAMYTAEQLRDGNLADLLDNASQMLRVNNNAKANAGVKTQYLDAATTDIIRNSGATRLQQPIDLDQNDYNTIRVKEEIQSSRSGSKSQPTENNRKSVDKISISPIEHNRFNDSLSDPIAKTTSVCVKMEISIDADDFTFAEPSINDDASSASCQYNEKDDERSTPAAAEDRSPTTVNKSSSASRRTVKSRRCRRCDPPRRFVHRNSHNLRYHCHLEYPFECFICHLAFRKRETLLTHIRTQHDSSMQHMCDQCAAQFRSRQALVRHLFCHTDSRPFKCVRCNRTYKNRSALQSHMLSHSGIKRYECATCNKQFASCTGLQVHVRSHTGEKPFVCEHCGSRFADPSTWRQHLLIHTGELPYRCHLCGKGTTQAGNLKSHLRHFHKLDVTNVRVAELKYLRLDRDDTTAANTIPNKL